MEIKLSNVTHQYIIRVELSDEEVATMVEDYQKKLIRKLSQGYTPEIFGEEKIPFNSFAELRESDDSTDTETVLIFAATGTQLNVTQVGIIRHTVSLILEKLKKKLCQTCLTEEAESPHDCPYQNDKCDNPEFRCNCCADCRANCLGDI